MASVAFEATELRDFGNYPGKKSEFEGPGTKGNSIWERKVLVGNLIDVAGGSPWSLPRLWDWRHWALRLLIGRASIARTKP